MPVLLPCLLETWLPVLLPCLLETWLPVLLLDPQLTFLPMLHPLVTGCPMQSLLPSPQGSWTRVLLGPMLAVLQSPLLHLHQTSLQVLPPAALGSWLPMLLPAHYACLAQLVHQ